MKIATVKDVARIAGVSAMTVSRVLNNTGSVSEATRQKVLSAAEELHYYKNTVARGLRINETRTIGLVLSDSSELAMARVVRGIQDMAGECEYSVIGVNTDRSVETEKEAVETLVRKHIDGLILVSPMAYTQDEMAWLKDLGIPVVILMRTSEMVDIDTVLNDNFDGGYQVGEHLIEQGCQRFFFLSLSYSTSGRGRMAGCRKALSDHNIPEENIEVVAVSQYPDDAYRKTLAHIDEIRNYDALVCGCDAVAFGAMRALHENNIRIPQDVKVIGYDGLEMGQYLDVSLTSIAQPFYEIGRSGVKVLLKRIQDPEAPVAHIIYRGKLVVRESTAK